ncbi:major facilitator superfamily domain-containing protein [Immersiella caudata]|uniref:Major facilitator superfamily domain-containing protein n=1 Tax=Immersiella caudata TaxID=314043 RepID=A0AA39X4B7_9PEZI|nr:major facilitator superfamily domain-containing protein [Immersiella caudata]
MRPREVPEMEVSVNSATGPPHGPANLAAFTPKDWRVVFGSSCAILTAFSIPNSAAVIQSYLSTHQLADARAFDIGWIFGLHLFLIFFLGPLCGYFFDKDGPRFLVLIGHASMALSYLLLIWCTEYYQSILAYSVLGGLGGALLNVCGFGSIALFINTTLRGRATGIAATFGGLGGIIFSSVLQHTLPNLGWSWSWGILCIVAALLGLPSCFSLNLPRDAGAQKKWPDRGKFFYLISLGLFFLEWGFSVPLTFIISYATAHEINSTAILPCFNGSSVLGRVLSGFIVDRCGAFKTTIIYVLICAVAVLALWLPAGGSEPMLLLFVLLFGVASGGILASTPVYLSRLCNEQEVGRYFSTALALGSFGALSSPPIAGLLLHARGWPAVILFSGLSYIIALVFFVVLWLETARYGLPGGDSNVQGLGALRLPSAGA